MQLKSDIFLAGTVGQTTAKDLQVIGFVHSNCSEIFIYLFVKFISRPSYSAITLTSLQYYIIVLAM